MAGVKKPNILKDANVYIEGKDFLGKAEIELPKVAQQTVEHSGMGISGKLELPVVGHTEKLEGKLKFTSFDSEALKVLYDSSKAHHLDVRGSVQRYNPQTGAMEEFPVQVVMRAFVKEADLPTFKQAQGEGPEFSYSAVYFKLVVDGEEVIELDPMNYIYKVNGQNLLEQTRANLGMS